MKLKPCPFCGGEAKLMNTFDSDNGAVIIVTCLKCFSKTGLSESGDEAIKMWNKRVEYDYIFNSIENLIQDIRYKEYNYNSSDKDRFEDCYGFENNIMARLIDIKNKMNTRKGGSNEK